MPLRPRTSALFLPCFNHRYCPLNCKPAITPPVVAGTKPCSMTIVPPHPLTNLMSLSILVTFDSKVRSK